MVMAMLFVWVYALSAASGFSWTPVDANQTWPFPPLSAQGPDFFGNLGGAQGALSGIGHITYKALNQQTYLRFSKWNFFAMAANRVKRLTGRSILFCHRRDARRGLLQASRWS